MRVAITGASGLIGTALQAALRAAGHATEPLARDWRPASLAAADAVVNLAGASIAAGRWTRRRRALVRSSRLATTRRLVAALAALPAPPRVLVSASGSSVYGDRGGEVLTEAGAPGAGFLAELAREWEAAALAAQASGVRVVVLRFGMVLSSRGGALPRIVRPFRLGLGGRLGNGRQWMPWIALADAVGVIAAALADARYRGPLNVVAPELVTNADFTRTLARSLGRPAILPIPAPLLRLAFGAMAEELLLASHRVLPARLADLGFAYRFPRLRDALEQR